jgi:hypothetical protein
VPNIVSSHATWEYSLTRPPSEPGARHVPGVSHLRAFTQLQVCALLADQCAQMMRDMAS